MSTQPLITSYFKVNYNKTKNKMEITLAALLVFEEVAVKHGKNFYKKILTKQAQDIDIFFKSW